MEIQISNCRRQKGTGFIEMIMFSFYIQSEGAYASYSDFIEYESNADYAKDNKTSLPFRDLTVEMIKGWILSKYSAEKLAEIEAALLIEINTKINHPYEYGLPWEIITEE